MRKIGRACHCPGRARRRGRGTGLSLGARSRQSLSFEVRDAASKSSVWDSTVRLQNRVIRGFYSTSYRFTHLRPGTFDLTVSAPHYEPASVRVRIRTGRTNTIAPISLVGLRDPRFLAAHGGRQEGSAGARAPDDPPWMPAGDLIEVFPCIDVKIAVRVSVQLKGGAPALTPSKEGAERGTRLFQGKVDWTWNPAADAVYRYDAVVPGIPPDAGPYVVVDYVVLIPDPRKISSQEVDALTSELLQINDARALGVSLRPYMNKVKMESGSLWNIR